MSNPSRIPVSNLRDSPRHGRTRSLSMNHPAPPQLSPHPTGPTSPPQGHRPIPILRRAARQPPNDLQNFSERSIEPFCRWAFMVVDARGREQPNYNFTSDIENAIWVSETIDGFDNDPRMIHELILCISDLELGAEGLERVRQNRSMVEILLYRHYQRHGGLMLPPTAPGVQALQDHQRAVQEAREECLRRTGRQLRPEEYPRIKFPAWRPLSGQQNHGGVGTDSGKGKGPSHSPGGQHPWSVPGDGMLRRPLGGGVSGINL